MIVVATTVTFTVTVTAPYAPYCCEPMTVEGSIPLLKGRRDEYAPGNSQ